MDDRQVGRAARRVTPKEAARAKYAPWVSLLAEDREHFRRADARAYWAMAPHYVGQMSESACSLASATMVVNALVGGRAGEKLATAGDVLDAAGDAAWRAGVADDGRGASGAEFALNLGRALAAFGVAAIVEHVPVGAVDRATADRLRAVLRDAEQGDRLVIGHFLMEPVIGDGDYGHFSPLGAFDSVADRVLVLDVYRVAYEPYWVPLERLLAGMATRDKVAGEPRGWLEIRPL